MIFFLLTECDMIGLKRVPFSLIFANYFAPKDPSFPKNADMQIFPSHVPISVNFRMPMCTIYPTERRYQGFGVTSFSSLQSIFCYQYRIETEGEVTMSL